MPKYSYKAKQGARKIIDGFVDAENIDQAIRKVINKGFTPIDVQQSLNEGVVKEHSRKNINKISFVNRVRLVDLALFTRQMSDLVDASVPILRALQIVSKQTKSRALKEVVQQMATSVNDGSAFSNALMKHTKVFSPLYINMVRTGEMGGQLTKVLERLACYYEKEVETRSKVQSSLAYPLFIFAVGVITIFVLLTFVIPRMTVMFDDFGQSLPLPTIILMNISAVFAKYWWLILCCLGLCGLYGIRWVQTPQGKSKFDHFVLKIPVLGNFLKTVEVGRFARTLGTLIESGIVITSALNAVSTTIENSALKDEVKMVASDVANGTSLKAALRHCSLFPEMAVNMISVGEETGHLEKGLYKIAEAYERQNEQNIKTLISLLGPLVLVVIVAFVGFVVIAMLLPILQMNLLVQ